MKFLQSAHHLHAKRGFVSVIALLFLASVVLFMLANIQSMSGSKSLESQQQSDSVAALALAESGLEVGLANITTSVNLDDTTFSSSCTTLQTSSPISLGSGTRGTFQFVPSKTTASSSLCPIRVTGLVNTASRTAETQVNIKTQIGDGNFGNSPSLTLKNPYNVPAVAVFNLAWGLKRSSGQVTTGNGTSASPSTSCAGCIARWNLASSGGGNNAVGSMGTSMPVAANSSTTFSETLTDDRNYVQVGLILGGTGPGQPNYIGSFADNKETGNTSNNLVTTGNIPTGQPSSGGGWCNAADTLVFGVSGVGPYQANPPPPAYDYSAAMTAVMFNTTSGANNAVNLNWVSHYPNTDGTSPNTAGDVFSEIWWTYNPYIKMTANAASSGTTIMVSSTTGLVVGTVLKVYSGTGVFVGGTKVASVVSPTQFTVNTAPNQALVNGDVICGGICALFNAPASGATTVLTVSRTNSAATAQQYVGGLACFSGVDPTKVKRVSSSGISMHLWHEILSGE